MKIDFSARAAVIAEKINIPISDILIIEETDPENGSVFVCGTDCSVTAAKCGEYREPIGEH